MRRSARGSSAATGREDTEQGVRRAHKETVEKPKQPDRDKRGMVRTEGESEKRMNAKKY